MSNVNKFNCNDLNEANINQNVNLFGWIKNKRKLGKLLFIDLYDMYGITQIIFDKAKDIDKLKNLNLESAIEIQGKVVLRKNPNLHLKTGKIEVLADTLKILNASEVVPFNISDEVVANEELRLKYRFLDLRRKSMINNLKFRSKTLLIIRNYLDKLGFLEIETPILSNSSPEGARDFLVPSRIHSMQFYALPQSPQIYKQLLMASTVAKYFQIARCFRDEDLRSDRQFEFSQLDIELSFTSFNEIKKIIESLLLDVLFKQFKIKNINFSTLDYQQAIDLYGSDKPDIRFNYQLQNISLIFKKTSFQVFKNILKNYQEIKALFFDFNIEVKEIKELSTIAKQNGFNNLGYLHYQNNQWNNDLIAKFLSDQEKTDLKRLIDKNFNKSLKNFTIIILGGNNYDVSFALGAIRNKVAYNHKLYNLKDLAFLWIINFPLFVFNKETKQFEPSHHPFTLPTLDSQKYLNSDLSKVKSESYDLILNGYELGGGSLRIHDKNLQIKIFEILKIDKKTYQTNFNALLKAFDYGLPPHGGIALGIDRLIMILLGLESIKDVIAFPKNSHGCDLLMNSPNKINDKDLEILSIKPYKIK